MYSYIVGYAAFKVCSLLLSYFCRPKYFGLVEEQKKYWILASSKIDQNSLYPVYENVIQYHCMDQLKVAANKEQYVVNYIQKKDFSLVDNKG